MPVSTRRGQTKVRSWSSRWGVPLIECFCRLSLRTTIDLLAHRVDELCDFIYQNGLTPPSTDEETAMALSKVGCAPKYMKNSQSTRRNQLDRKSTSPTTPAQVEAPAVSLNPHDVPIQQDATSNPPITPPELMNAFGTAYQSVNATAAFPSVELGWQDDSPPFGMDASDFLDLSQAVSIFPNTDSNFLNPTELLPGVCPPLSETGSSDAEGTEALVDQLSDRIGTLQIGPGGQTRYYGPTSTFNLVDMPAPDNLTVHRTIRRDGNDVLTRLGLGKEVPAELEQHLTDLYFAWQDPSSHAVDRNMYEKSKKSWVELLEDTPYYSESLRNAMYVPRCRFREPIGTMLTRVRCALGAAFEPRHHPTFVTFPRSLADFFADRAKALLEIELDCPTVATVQALVVLSGHDIGCKRDARGWLFSGECDHAQLRFSKFMVHRYGSKASIPPRHAYRHGFVR